MPWALRAETMQGPRVTLARARLFRPAAEFEVTLLNDGLLPVVEEWMRLWKAPRARTVAQQPDTAGSATLSRNRRGVFSPWPPCVSLP